MSAHCSQQSTEKSSQLPLKTSLFAVFLCTLFGANAVAIKVSLSGIGPFTAAGIRFFIAATVLFLWSKIRGTSLQVTQKQVYQLLILSSVFFIQMSCFYHGQNQTTASHGTLIANTLPFVVMILAHFFLVNDRIHLQKIVGLMLGFSGVMLLFWDSLKNDSSTLHGDSLIFLAVIFWGCNVTFIKRIISEFHPLQITIFPMIFSVPFFFLGGFFWDTHSIRFINGEIILAVFYQSLVTASFGFVMWNTLIKKYGATALHSFVFIMPVSGVFFGVILLGEPISFHLLGSITLVSLGLIIVNSTFGKNQETVIS